MARSESSKPRITRRGPDGAEVPLDSDRGMTLYVEPISLPVTPKNAKSIEAMIRAATPHARLEKLLSRIERWARATLREHGVKGLRSKRWWLPVEDARSRADPHSQIELAASALLSVDYCRRGLRDRNVEFAAAEAASALDAYHLAQFKRVAERNVIAGRRYRRAQSWKGHSGGRARAQKLNLEQRDKAIVAEAQARKAKRPSLSWRSIAHQLAPTYKLSLDRTYRIIRENVSL